MSKRAYKEAWGEEDVLNYFRTHSGKQFDPELVDIFLGIQPVVKSIRDRFNGSSVKSVGKSSSHSLPGQSGNLGKDQKLNLNR